MIQDPSTKKYIVLTKRGCVITMCVKLCETPVSEINS